MQVVALVDFHDNEKNVDRKAGEEFVVSQKRFDEINSVAENFGLKAIVGESVRTVTAAKQTPESRAKRTRKVAK